MTDGSKKHGALNGVRVVDLTTVLMGPLASRMLADHGADVIHIAPMHAKESISTNDGGIGAIALDIHRNKRSVKLDLKSDHGKKALWDLIATADVLVTNMRAAALERLGFSADQVRKRHPEIVYCLANGYGQDGPYAERAAYDDAIQALSGFAGLFGKINGTPAYAPSVIVDKICSLFIVQAVLASLLHKRATGEGQTITVPMFETMAAFNLIEHYRGAALIPPKGTPGYPRLINRERRPYRCADGWIALLPYSGKNWRDFFKIIGRPELAEDPKYVSNEARMQNIEELYGIVSKAAEQRTTDEWQRVCDEYSIPCNPVLGLEDLVHDPHLEAVDFMTVTEHPSEGKYRSVRDPVTYDGLSTQLRRHAPIPGEHTAEVLGELGWEEDEIKDFILG